MKILFMQIEDRKKDSSQSEERTHSDMKIKLPTFKNSARKDARVT